MMTGIRRWPKAIILVCTLLAACAEGKPFDPPQAGEILPGPGLFTGENGEFRLLRP